MTASVLAAQAFDLAAAPESGAPAVLAAAEEQVTRAEERLEALQRELAEAEKHAVERTKWAEATLTAEAIADQDEAEDRVTDLRRRVLSATARLETARAELEEIHGNGASA